VNDLLRNQHRDEKRPKRQMHAENTNLCKMKSHQFSSSVSLQGFLVDQNSFEGIKDFAGFKLIPAG